MSLDMKTDFRYRLFQGDSEALAATLSDESIQTIITSPPYFRLRKYGVDDELGQESKLECYISRLVSIIEKLKRPLRNDGTLWLNLGDTYDKGDLLGVPWRIAIALKDKGWILRSDIIWHKPNAMPSPARSRPTLDHEYLFLFSKEKKYYYDADSIREPHVTFSPESKMRGGRNHLGKKNGTPENGKYSGYQNLHSGNWDTMFHPKGRNKRTVWSVPLGKFREAHFAVFPEGLVTPCIMAGSKPNDIVLDPFSGAGTTGLVARKLDRRYIGFDINQKYVDIASRRLSEVQPTLSFDS